MGVLSASATFLF